MTSSSLRESVFSRERKRFFASCIVIVLAPRTKRPALRLATSAERIADWLKPWWWKNAPSSVVSTATCIIGLMVSSGAQSSDVGPVSRSSGLPSLSTTA